MRKVDTVAKMLMRSFIRWSWLLLLCVVLGFALGKLLTNVLPPTYQATAIVQLTAQSHASQASIIQPVAVYSSLVTSDAVLDPPLKKYPQLDRMNFAAHQLTVTTDGPSQSIQLQVSLPQAQMASDVANLLAQNFVSQENTAIKAQYATQLQLIAARIAGDDKEIDHLNRQYASTSPSNTTALTQVSDQISQQLVLKNQDVALQQSLLTEQALYSAPLTIIQAAVPPSKPASLAGQIPFPLVMLLLLFVLGLILMALLEQGVARASDPATLRQKVDLPVIGALRWTKPMPIAELVTATTPYAEDGRVMMADLLFQLEETKARTVALTALRSGAGTSTIATQLAALVAQSERQVLLVDANLYRPSLHTQLGLPNTDGLALMLEEARQARLTPPSVANYSSSGGVDSLERLPLEKFIKSTRFAGLHLLPAGKTLLNPADLLSMPEMGQFLNWASRSVDLIIVDCPSLDYGDAHMLGALSDQTLVVVDATRDQVNQVVKMRESLRSTGVKLSGLIVNKLGRWI